MSWPYEEDAHLFKIRNPRLVNDPHIILPNEQSIQLSMEYKMFLRRFINFRARPFPVSNELLYQFLQEQFYLQYQRDQDILQKLEAIMRFHL